MEFFNQDTGAAGKKAVLLLSGGIDSATCGAIAKKEGFSLYALSFSYGQRHSIELEAAKKIAAHLGVVTHTVARIDLRMFGGSALTASIEVPKSPDGVLPGTAAIPVTYVPARNTIFLSYALAWAEVLGSADIFIGVNAVDYSGYPDCRPEFIRAFEKTANLGTRAGVQGARFTIHTPLISLTKSAIIAAGAALGLDFGLTHSCYDPSPEGAACGACDSCLIRKKGFEQAGLADPTRYR
jgi:7-cyano-7-deazaguanine synthase